MKNIFRKKKHKITGGSHSSQIGSKYPEMHRVNEQISLVTYISLFIYFICSVRRPVVSKADVVFLMDTSDGVSADAFKAQKEFIKSTVRQFDISRDKTRAAVIRYGTDSTPVIGLDTYGSLLDFTKAIDRIAYVGGERRIDKALYRTKEVLEGSREGVLKVVIVLTTGPQAKPPGSRALDETAQSLRDGGASVYVIGIGSQPDIQELKTIAGRESHVFLATSSELKAQAPYIGIHIASAAGESNTHIQDFVCFWKPVFI